MMNEAAKADSDSLMVLQALLKIRSDSVAESGQALSAGKSFTTTTFGAGAATQYEVSNENNRKRPAPSMTLQQQHRPTASKLSHVTPPFGALSPRSALSPTFTLNLGMQQNDTHLTSAHFPPQVDPVAVSSAPDASLQVMAPDTIAMQANPVKNGTEAAAKPAVRTTEIEAALRSKPQRGKKRDNLSALERLELTRTRNREHAKSTRIRKKARHQELLDNEQKYHDLKKMEDLRKGRSECVFCFLSTRQSMLRSSLDEPNASNPEEENQPPLQGSNQAVSSNDQNPGQVTPQRVVKFLLSNESFLASTSPPSSVRDTDAANKLCGFVDSDFEFTIVGSTLDCSSRVTPETAMSTMASFEKSLATRVKEKLGDSFVRKLSYTIVTKEAIAVNDHGTGFAEVVVSSGCSHFEVKLMTCVLKLSFVPDSHKLKSIVWNITKERFDDLPNVDPDCPCSESLCCQTSFPSVVSLDHPSAGGDGGVASGEQKPPASEDGPGMDI